MYKITWDSETGGILLNLKVAENTLSVAPRPVFWEELDLLGLEEQGWKYPHCDEPLMWACNKQYFYRGQYLFDAQGANIYDAPKVVLQKGVEPMKLVPVNMKKMLDRNKDPMFLMESEAIDFIRDTYIAYSAATKSVERVAANKIDFEALTERIEKKTKQKMAIIKQDCDSFDVMPLEQANELGKRIFQTTRIDYFLASFSGGKDSQVVLDLCTRAIPPSAFQVIYSDTGYELPSSLDLYKDVQEFYGKKFPEIVEARMDRELDMIDEQGTADFYLSARELSISARKQTIPLCFRGPITGSLVSFLAQIAYINPLPPHYYCPNCNSSDFPRNLQKSLHCGLDLPDRVCPVCGKPMRKDGYDLPV